MWCGPKQYSMEIEVPTEYIHRMYDKDSCQIVCGWIKNMLSLPFSELPLYINHENPTLRFISRERLAGSLNSVDIVDIIDGDIRGVYALFQEKLDL